MIPQLFDSNRNLECWLTDTVSCKVKEEKNSIYELELEYIQNGKYALSLLPGKLIKAKANAVSGSQIFKINSVETNLKGNTIVKAEHISYALSGYPLPLVTDYRYSSIADIVNWIERNTYHKTGDFTITGSVFSSEQSITLKTVGNIFEFFAEICEKHNLCMIRDNMKIDFSRTNTQGQSFPLIIYGVNLQNYKCVIDKSNIYNCIFPYYIWNENGTQKLITLVNNSNTIISNSIKDSGNYYYLSNYSQGDTIHCLMLDIADVVGSDYIVDCIKSSGYINFTNIVKEYAESHYSELTQPSICTTVDFLNLTDTINYKNLAPLQKLGMHSYVTINIPHLQICTNVPIVSYEYDTLRERYNTIRLGNIEDRLSLQFSKGIKTQNISTSKINTLPSLIYSGR